jgi:hypothetical protein
MFLLRVRRAALSGRRAARCLRFVVILGHQPLIPAPEEFSPALLADPYERPASTHIAGARIPSKRST